MMSLYASAQTYDPSTINKKAVFLYEHAVSRLRDGLLQQAVPYLKQAIAIDSNYLEAYLSLAGVYGEFKDYKNAILNYSIVKRKDTAFFAPYQLPLSINFAGAGLFEEALQTVDSFLVTSGLSERSVKSGKYRKKCYEFAIDYKKKHPDSSYVFAPVNLGDSVNSEFSEYYPAVTIDDSLLVFTRRTGDSREDFMQSRVLKNGQYGKAEKIRGDINLERFKGAITMSPDGEWMIFAGNFSGLGYGNYDLYISYNTPSGWSEPENLGQNINTEYWESSPSISPDKRVLYFSSDRPGGYGGRDLYMSIRQPNGKFGRAINMGEKINTIGDELAPYVHADNQTMYFTSDALPGYGGTDLFVTRKQPDGEWGTPENLGYPINTIENEGSIGVSADGTTAFYASDRSDSRGELDLYKFGLRKDIRPFKTLYLKGRVFDAKTGKGLPSSVELIDNATNQPLMKIQTDELGEYLVTLPNGKDYTFTVDRKGYLFYSELYDANRLLADSVYKKDIPLQPVALNAHVVMQNIQFEVGSYKLLHVSLIELNKLLQILNDNPTLKVEISGYTDNIGNAEENLKLSTSRAKAVVDYLIEKKIDAARLSYKGYGSSKPVATNATEQGRAKNRRTEFAIVGM